MCRGYCNPLTVVIWLEHFHIWQAELTLNRHKLCACGVCARVIL
jgi:hypothetical protein